MIVLFFNFKGQSQRTLYTTTKKVKLDTGIPNLITLK
jgi:hypothetical protein